MDLPRIGDVFEQRYEIQEILGAGGFAKVYLARDASLGRPVVIKVLAPGEAGYSNTIRARFLREARVFAGLSDQHTITMFDHGESANGLLFMVFEHIAGKDLSGVLESEGRLSPAVVGHILEQLLSALGEAHDKGILHRDIKPANVLIYEYDNDPYRVKLIDFGIAKDTKRDERLTRTGHVVGTVRYMSPEQLLGGEVGPSSDLYSLGLVAYELLTGRPAIDGPSQKELLKQQVSDEPLRVPPAVAPPALRAAIDHLMGRTSALRPSSATEALHQVRAARSETGTWAQTVVPAPPATFLPHPPAPAPERVRGRPAVPPPPAAQPRHRAAAVFLVAAIATAALAVALFMSRRDAERPVHLTRVNNPLGQPAVASPRASAEGIQADAGGPAADRAAPLDGCGAEPPFVGRGRLRAGLLLGSGYETYVPKNYDPNRRYPVLLMFHRKFTQGDKLLRSSQMGKSADERGFIAIAFDSADPTDWPWEDGARMIGDALALAEDQLCIDTTRLYAFGDETGSSMVREMACARALSAVAVTNVTTGSGCKPAHPVPRLRIYAKHDLMIPPAGGKSCSVLSGNYASSKGIDAAWQLAHGCKGNGRPWGQYAGGSCEVWDCEVAPYVVCATDSGSVWPHLTPVMEPDRCQSPEPEVYFPYRDAIWDFFDEFGRRVPPWNARP